MRYNIGDALLRLTPGAQWVLRGDEYSGLEWLDTEQEKPIEDEIVQKVAELEYQEEINEYQRQRAAEYPSYADQFDQIYHEGIDAWKSTIQTVKDKYPKQTMDADVLQTRKDKAIFDLQTERYLKATERLSQYILSEGREALTEESTEPWPLFLDTDVEVYDEWTGDRVYVEETRTVEVSPAIAPLPATIETTETNTETGEITTSVVPNPAIVRDTEERAAAQATIDATPQAVIDSLS